MTGEQSERATSQESWVDEWYYNEYAYSETYVGLRGDMATKAVNRFKDESSTVLILVPPENLDSHDEVSADEVPEWAESIIEKEFEARSAEIKAIFRGGA